jgi:hypothetical protein
MKASNSDNARALTENSPHLPLILLLFYADINYNWQHNEATRSSQNLRLSFEFLFNKLGSRK